MRAVACVWSSPYTVLYEIEQRGWDLHPLGDQIGTPLEEALQALKAGEAEVLVADELAAVSKSLGQFGALFDRSRKQGWELVILSPWMDTSTTEGLEAARCLAWAAGAERDLMYARLESAERSGRKLGRPLAIPPEIVTAIREMWHRGMSLRAIARQLTHEEVPTAHGGRSWYASTVQYVLDHHPGSPLAG